MFMKPSDRYRLLLLKLGQVAIAAICISIVLSLDARFCLAQGQANSDGWVVLAVDEYRALRKAAYPAAVQPAPPPIEAALTRVDYDLKINGELASGEARLTVDVIKDSWVRVAIPTGLLVREARVDGKQVSLVTEPSGKGANASYLLFSHAGRSVVSLTVEMAVSSVAGTDILQLPAGAAAVTRGSVTLSQAAGASATSPSQGVEVHVTGGLLLEKSESATESHWVAYGRGNEALTFAWKRRVEERKPALPLKLRGSLTELVGLGEDSTQVSAEVQIAVLQGEATEVHLQLPEHLAINQVAGALVADWESTAQELTVTFIQPVTQTTAFTVNGEVRLPRDGQIDVPIIRLASAERESGGLAVEVLGAGEIRTHKAAGMEEAEAADLEALISTRQSPSLIAFRLLPSEGQSRRSLALDVARYTPQAILTANIEEAYYSALVTPDGKMLVVAKLAVRNNQRSFLRLKLPSTAVLWSASVAGRPIRPGLAPDGSLLLSLEKTRSGEDSPAFPVEVAYLDKVPKWTEKGRARVQLLTLDLPISKSGLVLRYSPLFRLTPVPGSLRSAPYQPPQSPAFSPNYSSAATAATQAIQKDAEDKASSRGQAIGPSLRPTHASTPVRNLPIRVAFPNFGPSIFFVSELTGENQMPVLEFDYQRDGKRGDR